MSSVRHIVFATFGSLGDVHPFFAVGRALQTRGHRVTIATSAYHRAKIEAEGFGFHAVRPDIAEFGGPGGLLRTFTAGPLGPIRVLRRLILPRLRETAADLLAVARDADFLGAHPILYPAPMVAEKLGLPWAATVLQPFAFFSAHDPARFRGAPPAAHRVFGRLARMGLGPLIAPIHRLRAELGLPPARAHPMFGGQFAPQLNLALFSPLFGPPQPDWPRATKATGFPFFDEPRSASERVPDTLAPFLAAGAPPIGFTLGTAAVDLSVRFYLESIAAAQAIGARAILLANAAILEALPRPLPPGILALPYAPHAAVFPRASLIVHSGGIGTTAQALRAGRPQLVVPFGFDQPDNAGRVVRLGVGQTLPIARYRSAVAQELLARGLANAAAARTAAEFSRRISAEDGARSAADAILRTVEAHPRTTP